MMQRLAARNKTLLTRTRLFHCESPHASLLSKFFSTQAEAPAKTLLISDRCANKIVQQNKSKSTPNRKLRVSVESGGCSGYKIDFTFTDTQEEDDILYTKDGAEVVIDKVSLGFISGSTIDFDEQLMSQKFALVSVPKAIVVVKHNTSFDRLS